MADLVIRKTIRVRRSPEEVYYAFTACIHEWWPQAYNWGEGGRMVLEAAVGGRVLQRFPDGTEIVIGAVYAAESPTRLGFTWKWPEWQAHTDVEVHFHGEGEGTRIELVHSGWERLGDLAQDWMTDYSRGWDEVLPGLERWISGGTR